MYTWKEGGAPGKKRGAAELFIFKNLFSISLSAGEAVFDGTFGENPNNVTDPDDRVEMKIINGDCSEGNTQCIFL